MLGSRPWIRALFVLMGVALVLSSGCTVTSPYWGYVPASRTAPIPFQAWNISATPMYVECATDTNGHGGPAAGESSYKRIATLTPSAQPSLDGLGQQVFSASAMVTLPNECWRRFYYSPGFDQANVRVVVDTSSGKAALRSFDKAGLSCLGRHTGLAARWDGWVGKNCEFKLTGASEPAPYIVLRIPLPSTSAFTTPGPVPLPSAAPPSAPSVTPVYTFSAQDLERVKLNDSKLK